MRDDPHLAAMADALVAKLNVVDGVSRGGGDPEAWAFATYVRNVANSRAYSVGLHNLFMRRLGEYVTARINGVCGP